MYTSQCIDVIFCDFFYCDFHVFIFSFTRYLTNLAKKKGLLSLIFVHVYNSRWKSERTYFFLKWCLMWNSYIFLMHLLAHTCTCNQNFLLPIRNSCCKLVDINNCTVWHIIFFIMKTFICMLCILKLRKLCRFL